MSNRALLFALTVGILGATGYSVIDTLDESVTADFKKNVVVFFTKPFYTFQKPDYKNTIAQQYGGSNPHGEDPHGDDPHDEVHDPALPANADRNIGRAPTDVYGGTIPNTQAPY